MKDFSIDTKKGINENARNVFKTYGMLLCSIVAVVIFISWVSLNMRVPHKGIKPNHISISKSGNVTKYTLDVSKYNEHKDKFLMFKSKGNIITVKSGGQIIYSYGEKYAKQKKDIGRIYASVPLLEAGGKVDIELRPADSNASDELKKFDICEAKDATRYYLTNDTQGLPLAAAFLLFGFAMIVISILVGRQWKLRFQTFLMGVVLFSMSIELLDKGGHYLVFYSDQHAWNIFFYPATYTVLLACPLFFYSIAKDHLSYINKMVLYLGYGFIVGFQLTELIMVFLGKARFCEFSPLYKYLLGISAIFALYGVGIVIRKKILKDFSLYFLFLVVIGLCGTIIMKYRYANIVGEYSESMFDRETFQATLLFVLTGFYTFKMFKNSLLKAREKELQLIKLNDKLRDMRVKAFANQIQPHFLYNSLTSIQEVVLENGEYAYDLLGDFTVYLRNCIHSITSDTLVDFCEELASIEAYLNIEKMRLESRLTVEYDIQAKSFKIMPLTVQPFVENAVRHGIFNNGAKGGIVLIKSYEDSECWIVEVSDTGIGFDVEKVLKGIDKGESKSYGMRNVIYRLENAMDAKIDISSTVGQGTDIKITIPKH